MIQAMYGMGVDTLKAVRALEKAGFDASQAEALVSALGGGMAGNAATREDLRDLRNGTREEIRLVRTELREEIAGVRTEMRAGFAAVRGEIAELREETRAEFVAVRGEIAELRAETRAEFVAVRGEIAELREETRAEFAAVREEMRTEFAAVREEMGVMKADIADLRTELVKVRSACLDELKSLKAHMYGLLLAQATLIVGLIVGLQRLF